MTRHTEWGPVAFLFPAFPVLHQTFVLWEVLSLRELGIPIVLYSLKRPDTPTQQPEGAALADEVDYLPRTLSRAVLRENLRFLCKSPLRYMGVFVWLALEWWRDRRAADLWLGDPCAREPMVGLFGLRARLRWSFNRSDLTYLFKSLWLVFPAVYLGHLLRARGINRLHAHWASYPTTVALVIRRLFGIPFSFSAHAYDVHVVPRLLPVKVRMAEWVVTCAEYNAKYLRMLAGVEASKRISVNYHGVDLERFHPRGQLAEANGELPRIVTCGRLQLYKGHQSILRACARLKRPVRCILIGDGPQRRNLEQLAADLGIGDRVEFTGPLPQTQVVQILARADIFVLASILLGPKERRDVIPNVLLEAMAMELPVVASDIAGVSELITDTVHGRLVPQGNAAALAVVLEELLDDKEQRTRLGLEARRRVAADFDRRKNVAALARLFDEEATLPDGGAAPQSSPAAPRLLKQCLQGDDRPCTLRRHGM
jgi:colanic acid/amylovoran biosynthesis glycosyltransferase